MVDKVEIYAYTFPISDLPSHPYRRLAMPLTGHAAPITTAYRIVLIVRPSMWMQLAAPGRSCRVKRNGILTR